MIAVLAVMVSRSLSLLVAKKAETAETTVESAAKSTEEVYDSVLFLVDTTVQTYSM